MTPGLMSTEHGRQGQWVRVERKRRGKVTLLTQKDTVFLMKISMASGFPHQSHFSVHFLQWLPWSFLAWGLGLSVPSEPFLFPGITCLAFKQTQRSHSAPAPESLRSCSDFITNHVAQHNGDIAWPGGPHYHLEEARLFKVE